MSTIRATGTRFYLRLLFPFLVAFSLTSPALVTVITGLELESVLGAILFGLAIVSAAFVLAWVAEAAELDLSGGLAIGILAIIAILPEYVVSIYFAFAAGSDPSMAAYASANLTGANRLLLGFGWPTVALLGFVALVISRAPRPREFGVSLDSHSRTDLGFLIIGSALALIVPITGQFHLIVGVLLVGLFVGYLWRISHAQREEPELEGTPAYVGALPKWWRRGFILAMTLSAAAVILLSAEPFAHYLLKAGADVGIEEYLLVQWLAPIASEAPEFTLALLFALRGKAGIGLAILISSKVNQWTALAGSLPIAYVIGGGSGAALPMDARQIEEFTLTSAQTFLGVALLMGLFLGFRSSVLLFTLFAATFIFPSQEVRYVLAYIYFALAAFYFWHNRAHLKETLQAPFKRPG